MAEAEVSVHATSIGSVNRAVLGHNVEWTEWSKPRFWEGEELAGDVMDSLRAMGIGSLRFPGGCHGDHYTWESGTGPHPQRPLHVDCFSAQDVPTMFGTDELLKVCRATGATPWMQTNPVSRTPEDMSAWAAYCRARGMPVPHWEIGNEIYLASAKDTVEPNDKRIAMSPEAYVQRARGHIEAIRKVEPDARFAAIGGSWTYLGPTFAVPDWNERVLPDLSEDVDILSIHSLYGPIVLDPSHWDPFDERAAMAVIEGAVAMPSFARSNLDVNLELVDSLAPGRTMDLAVTEWVPWYGFALDALLLGNVMGAGVYTAGILNLMISEPRVVAAHWLSLAKPIMGGCLVADDAGVHRSLHHAIFSLYGQHLGTERLRADVTCDTFDAASIGTMPAQPGVTVLDVVATSEGRAVSLFLVNRDLWSTLDVRVTTGSGTPKVTGSWTVTGHPLDTNGPLAPGPMQDRSGDPIRVEPGPTAQTTPEGFAATLPPCSVTTITYEMENPT